MSSLLEKKPLTNVLASLIRLGRVQPQRANVRILTISVNTDVILLGSHTLISINEIHFAKLKLHFLFSVVQYFDCQDAFSRGRATSGVYTVHPDNQLPFDVSYII